MTRPATSLRMLVVAASAALVVFGAALAAADPQPGANATTSILSDLGFSFQEPGPDRNAISFTKKGLLVPTPWGDFEATIVSTPVDRMVRVPLSLNSDPGQPRLQPYVTAGSRKNVDDDSVLEQARPSAFGDNARTNLKAGAGVLLKLDDRVELFGEYQFMRLHRDVETRGSLGLLGTTLGTTLDPSGFSLGISVRY